MKNILFLLILIPATIFAQQNTASINFGRFNPAATEGGFIIGYKGENFMDRNLSIGWSTSWFHKQYVNQELLNEIQRYHGVADATVTERKAKTNLHSVPLLFSLTSVTTDHPSLKMISRTYSIVFLPPGRRGKRGTMVWGSQL